MSTKSYPHPILGINDDLIPGLPNDCIVMEDPKTDALNFYFKLELKHGNSKIEELLKLGFAEYACEITCKDTFFRLCLHSKEPLFDFSIPRKRINGHIDFNCFISSKVNISNYYNPNFNEDYRGFMFNLEIGDYLAKFPSASFNTKINYDKLYAAGSFMQIVEGNQELQKPQFDLSGDKIMIELPVKMFEQYQKFDSIEFMEIVHSSIVFNALIYALQNIGNVEYNGCLWADAIKNRMLDEKLKNFDLEDKNQAYEIADILLANPYERLFNRLEQLNSNEED